MHLMDRYYRKFKYLRLSVTENCNFRCQYCLPNGSRVSKKQVANFLTSSEIKNLVTVFADLGVEKIRVTGGEPTLRRDFIDILRLIRSDSRIKTIGITTNGYRLLKCVDKWYQAGLNTINISIDSLSSQSFKLITGQNRLNEILAGVDKALTIGFDQVKVNAVLLKGLNDNLADYLNWIKQRSIELRFIELMETAHGKTTFNQFHLSGERIKQQLIRTGWKKMIKTPLSGPAEVFYHSDYRGKIGLILPYSDDFCKGCNRLRISANGKLHFCLFGSEGLALRDLLQSASQHHDLKKRILNGLLTKPEKHFLKQHNTGLADTLSYLGG